MQEDRPDSSEFKERIEQLLESCPTSPGVYLMKNEKADIIYVGKAKNLRSRVRSYFQNQEAHSAKTQHLVQHVRDIEFLHAGTEIEALLLENTLIKKWKPKYNIRLKDDKTYPYIRLDLRHDYPRPTIARKQVAGDGSEYFGPFPNATALYSTLRAAAKVFQLRDCRDHEFANRARPCLSYEIGQCTAPCVGLVTKDQYGQQVADFRGFIEGDSHDLESKLEIEMNDAAEKLEFEKAARLRDRLQEIRQTTQQDQRTVDTVDLIDRDIWALWPDPLLDAETWASTMLLVIVILQFRAGKWVGRVHRLADLGEGLETENLVANLILQHYQKHVPPQQILIPDGSEISDRASFAEAVAKVASKMVDVNFVPEIKEIHEKAEWRRLFDLARENAEQIHAQENRFQSRNEEGLVALAKMIDLTALPLHMECIDISNFQGEANVASCVVFKNGAPDKSQYRHYKIQGFEGQNDFESMREVISRRFGKPDSPKPDLLVIDGGKGQLQAVCEILKSLGADFPVVSLAKARTTSNFRSSEVRSSEERIFRPGQKNEMKFKNREALRIVTHLRDEAHRFAIEFHRLKRDQARGF